MLRLALLLVLAVCATSQGDESDRLLTSVRQPVILEANLPNITVGFKTGPNIPDTQFTIKCVIEGDGCAAPGQGQSVSGLLPVTPAAVEGTVLGLDVDETYSCYPGVQCSVVRVMDGGVQVFIQIEATDYRDAWSLGAMLKQGGSEVNAVLVRGLEGPVEIADVVAEPPFPASATAATIVSATPKTGSENDTLVVTWVPGDDSVPPAGDPAFYVTCVANGSACPKDLNFDLYRPSGSNETTVVSGLVEGTLYDCYVVAKDWDGTGVCSEPAQVSTYQRATAPMIASVEPKVGAETDTLVVTWMPGDDSVPPVGDTNVFAVRCVTSGSGCPTSVTTFDLDRVSGATTTEVGGLAAGTEYDCYVLAKSSVESPVCSAAQTVTTSVPGITWTTQTSAADSLWYSVTWGGPSGSELFVAVAGPRSGDRVMTSPDGITWTTQTSLPITAGIPVMTSPDGITWTTQTSAADSSWYSVTWGGPSGSELFVAVGGGGREDRVMTSPDGITWTTQTAPNNSWRSVTWGGPSGSELFVAVAGSGRGNRVMTSPDGITWTTRTSAADNFWYSVTWGGPSGSELFVAVAFTGVGNRVMTSPDGITWTTRTSAADNDWYSVTWGGPSGSELFVAVAGSGSGDRVMTSPDGITWTTRTSAADNAWHSVTWGGPSGSELFVAVATSGSGDSVMTSS
eukprot:jgi/Picre1/28641/NNA_004041.t1